MSSHGFTSAFAPELDQYITFKESMGFHGDSRIWHLRNFDAYCVERGASEFGRDVVEGWVMSTLSRRSGSCRSWMSYIRDFGRWMRSHGNPHAYVLADSWKSEFARAEPYLLSSQEIVAFFESAARVEAASPWAWQSVAFFALMHSCGLRTCEVRRLESKDVDLAEGVIDVLWSKGNRSRRLPISAQITGVLADCDRVSCDVFGRDRGTFFISSGGSPVAAAAVGVVFNRIWDQAGLRRAAGGKRPRPYDFRHHFAYANVERWMAGGLDVNAMLPYLARYMGHASLDSTYYYIHTSPDFMNGYADIIRDGERVLPEVGFQ